MKIRTTTPDKTNKYYIVKAQKGYSPCIEGNNPPYPGSVLNNCVGYAVSRFSELIAGNKIKYIGNRYPRAMVETAKKQGLSIHDKPVCGGIMVFAGEKEHCFIVEKINGKKIRTSESGWNSRAGVYNKTRSGKNWGMSKKYIFRGCIENPAVNPYPVPVDTAIKYGMAGDSVKWVQWVLKKFYNIEIDGKFGPITKEFLKDYQKNNNLKVDGIAGPETQKFIKNKYCII